MAHLTASTAQLVPPADGWDALVHVGLAGRKNTRANASVTRLAKRLQRLYPAASAAAQAVQQAGLTLDAIASPAAFNRALVTLSDG